MGFWSSLFKNIGLSTKVTKDKKKANSEVLKGLKIGDLVYLKFKTPDEIGIISGHNLICTRLNREEIDKREVEGSVSFIQKPSELLKSHVVEIATYSSPSMPGLLRRMTFLEDEIENIKKLGAK